MDKLFVTALGNLCPYSCSCIFLFKPLSLTFMAKPISLYHGTFNSISASALPCCLVLNFFFSVKGTNTVSKNLREPLRPLCSAVYLLLALAHPLFCLPFLIPVFWMLFVPQYALTSRPPPWWHMLVPLEERSLFCFTNDSFGCTSTIWRSFCFAPATFTVQLDNCPYNMAT